VYILIYEYQNKLFETFKKLDNEDNPIPKRDIETGEILRNELGEIIYQGQVVKY